MLDIRKIYLVETTRNGMEEYKITPNIWAYTRFLFILFFTNNFLTAQISEFKPNANDFILAKHFTSITVGMKEKLATISTDSLIWVSSDTNVVISANSIIKAKSVGQAFIFVRNTTDDKFDTCAVTVVPWVAGTTTLKLENVFPNMALLSVKEDTLYMQGTGGGNGWSQVYFYKQGMGSPRLLSNFPSDNTFGTDAEHLLPTSFGNFILAKRESVNAARKIYQVFPETQTSQLVYENYPPNPANPNYSYVLRQGWDYDSNGNIYLGEYNVNSDDNYQIRIFKGSNFGESWDVVYTFPPRSSGGYEGGIRHIHGCQVDPYTGDIWVTTGDVDYASRIYYNQNHLLPDTSGKVTLNLLGVGSQEFRVVSMAFTQDYIYWFMDAPCEDQKIFRMKRSDSYPTLSPSTPNDSDYRELIGVFKDKPFYNNVIYRDTNSATILVGSVYEDVAKYGCTFREIDDRTRVIGIKENPDKSFQVQEVLSIPAIGRYSTLMPVGVSTDEYIYFDAVEKNGYHSIYRSKYEWNNVDDLKDFSSDTLTVFQNTKLSFHGNLQGQNRVIVSKINSHPDSGTLPTGLLSVSPYYWTFYQNEVNQAQGLISVPISELTGCKPTDSLTWLARIDPGDDWTDIGGTVLNGDLQCTQTVSSFSQFAIGSYSGIIESNHDSPEMPISFELHQNYPNPFNNSTKISFQIPFEGFVSLKIFDLLGREISVLVNGHLDSGIHQRSWDASNYASGIFICTINVNSDDGKQRDNKSMKLILLK